MQRSVKPDKSTMSEQDRLMPGIAADVDLQRVGSALLSKILKTRLQRKARSIITSCLEFLLTDLSIVYTAVGYELHNGFTKYLMLFSVGMAAVYVVTLALFLYIHARCYAPKKETAPDADVEEAYAKSNTAPPFVDGLIEFKYPFQFRGKGVLWMLPYFAWAAGVFVVLLIGLSLLLVKDEVSKTTMSGLGAGALLMYQITSDFSEYWVLAHNQHEIQDQDPNHIA